MGVPPWLPECEQNIRDLGGTICDPNHCNDSFIKKYSHDYCQCKPPWQEPGGGPCTRNNSTPVPVFSANCYCCCGCFANQTPVAIAADKYKAIEEIRLGDNIYVAEDADLKNWSEKEVKFSAGTGDLNASNTMIKVDYGSKGNEDYLLVSRDQLFLMPDKKLKMASKLVPGKDELVMYDGTTVPVLSLEVGLFKKGLHHVATSDIPTQDLGGHLILAKGVVCGDYALQMGKYNEETSKNVFVEGHHELPEFGTYKYIQANQHLEIHKFKAKVPGANLKPVHKKVFEAHDIGKAAHLPKHAVYFMSQDLAWAIEKSDAPRVSPSSKAGEVIVKYLFQLFKGFYPDVNFYLDEQNELPNAYAFREFGTSFVIVTGGLMRMQSIKFEAMAFIIAHELGHLYGGPPLNENNYTCEGMADYAAIVAILPRVWYGNYAAPIIQKAMEQLTEYFGYIPKAQQGGKPGSTCMNLSVECRLNTMKAAFSVMPLPECAGGPKDPKLTVKGATVTQSISGTFVNVEFSTAVAEDYAENLGNYYFSPKLVAYSAVVEPGNKQVVQIKAEVIAGTEYEVQVYDVVSDDGHPLVPGKNTATFELAKKGTVKKT